MRHGLFIATFAGLALATALVAYFGVAEVGSALVAAGWSSLVVVCIVHLAPIVLCTAAWRLLIPAPFPSFGRCFQARWVREAVGNLLGLLPVTGELVGARFLTLAGATPMRAAASVVADLTAESVSQIFFTLIGLVILSLVLSPERAAPWIIAGSLATLPVAMVPIVARSRRILRMLEGLAGRVAASLKLPRQEHGETLAQAVHDIFGRRDRIGAAILLHLAAWIAATAETWAVLLLSGRPLGLAEAVALEAIVFAVRGAVFMVPSSIGIQEGSYVLVGAAFGLGPDTALALSLIKRARDLALGLPALIAWQAAEGNRLWRRRRFARSTG
jgi:putative membrane protein